jgi:hypothetical protein
MKGRKKAVGLLRRDITEERATAAECLFAL